jgi:hypothetical protein
MKWGRFGVKAPAKIMSDNSLIPMSDEQAKLGQEIAGAGRDFGQYLGDVLGDLPKDLVGLLVGDKVKAWRAKRSGDGVTTITTSARTLRSAD